MRSIPDNVIHPDNANTVRRVGDESLAGASNVQRLQESDMSSIKKEGKKNLFRLGKGAPCPLLYHQYDLRQRRSMELSGYVRFEVQIFKCDILGWQ